MILNDDGTIELAGQTLRRPTIGELWDFQDQAISISAEFSEEAKKIQAEVEAAGEEIDDETVAKVQAFTRRGILDHMAPLYETLFTLLGQEPIGPVEGWDVELLDPGIPARMINHWKNAPKASGGADPQTNPEPPRTTNSD